MNADSTSRDENINQQSLNHAKINAKKRRKGGRAEMEAVRIELMPMLALFTILLCYLLKNYSSDPAVIQPAQGTELPRSTTELAPEKSVQVIISDRVILVDDKNVASVKNGRVAKKHKRNRNPDSMYIEPLFDVLNEKADLQKKVAQNNKQAQAFEGLLTIVADKKVPFRLLVEVIFTAGEAEFGQYKFAVLKQEE